MALALSLTIAIVLIALRLIIHSQILLIDDDIKKQKLSKRIEKWTLMFFVPIGGGMAIAGFIFSYLRDSFIPVGFTLIATSLMLLVQSQSLNKRGEEAKSFGRKLRVYANILWWVALLGLVSLVIRLILVWPTIVK